MKNENKEINNPVKTANNLHNAGFNCAQAVFAALAPEFGLDQATAVKIAATLGGGIARTGETCGAVTGALLTIGLKDGSSLPDSAAKERIYQAARQFLDRFTGQHGSTLCRELLGCDLSTPEGMAEARSRNLFKEKCPLFVQDAVVMTSEMFNLTP